MKDLIVSQCIHGLSWSQRDTWTCHAAVRGMSSRALEWAACHRVWQCQFLLSMCVCVCVFVHLRVSLNACVSILSPRRDPVDCKSCPVVVTVPGAASGTIWPPWKSSTGATSEQACKRKSGDEDYCRTDSAKEHRFLVLPASCWRCERVQVQSNVNCQIRGVFKR